MRISQQLQVLFDVLRLRINEFIGHRLIPLKIRADGHRRIGRGS